MTIKEKFNMYMEDIVAIVLASIGLIWFMVLGFIDCEGLMTSTMPFRIWLAAQLSVATIYWSVKLMMNYIIDYVNEEIDH